jgi:hypothetical protein
MLTLDNERVAVAATARDFLVRTLPPAASGSVPVPINDPRGQPHEHHA